MSQGEKRYREFEATATFRFNADTQEAADRKLALFRAIFGRIVSIISISSSSTDLT